MQVLKYNHSDRTALTVNESGQIEIWTAAEPANKTLKVFSNRRGEKSVLSSDLGYTWQHYAKTAPHCEYYQLWFGEYPYSSWCWGIRLCTKTNEVSVEVLETEINPRGKTECEVWQEECLSYVPDSVEVDLVA